jgi:uncharacterized protein YndB with AHSA1/START domain
MTLNVDVAQQIGATTRSVDSRDHNGQPARVVTASRSYDTTIEDLWEAITSAQRIPRWFLPIEGDLRLGGRYQLKGNAGGEITRCEPPRHLSITWEYGGDVSWVNVALSAASDGTHLELEHIAHVPDDRWNQFGPGGVGVGWDMTLLGLDRHLAGGTADPKARMAWIGSDEGKNFVRRSSEDWRRASIESGTDEAAATAAANRTTAAYTGEPSPNA